MIINKQTNHTITDPEEVLKRPKHIFENFDSSEYKFVIPSEITDNQNKVIYKIGFLKIFLSLLYPEESNVKIYEKINKDWQVFIGIRQMERNYKKYSELFKKKREH